MYRAARTFVRVPWSIIRPVATPRTPPLASRRQRIRVDSPKLGHHHQSTAFVPRTGTFDRAIIDKQRQLEGFAVAKVQALTSDDPIFS